jgi:phage-related protein (TIGR01555 family)
MSYTVLATEDDKLTNVHHGYVMRFILREAPKIVKDIFQGWGYSQLSHVYTEMMKDQQLKHNIIALTNKALLEVVQMSGMKGLFSALADPESQAEIEARLEMVNRYRNNNSLIFLDKEDAYNQFTFGGLSGLADLMETNKDDMCAILEMSKLLLFGDTKGGLSGNADSEYLWYQGKVNGKQEEYLRHPLNKLIKFICLMSGADDDEMSALDYSFNTIIPEKPEQRSERFKAFTESLKELKDMGVYDEEDIKQEVISHADEYGVGIAPYKLKTIYDLREQEKNKKKNENKKVKYKIRPLVKVEKVRLVPSDPAVVEKVKLIPDKPVKTEKIKLVPKDSKTEKELEESNKNKDIK